MNGSSSDEDRSMKTFRFNTICTITLVTARTIEMQSCLYFHRQVCCDKKMIINCYQKLQVLTGNRFSTS